MSVEPAVTLDQAAARAESATARPDGPWSIAWRQFRRSKLALFGMAVLTILILVAAFAEVVAPYSPTQQNVALARRGPSEAYWLGTDELGRDMLTRLIYGARVSLSVAIVAQAMILLIGVPVGAAAGYFGGWVDTLLSRTIDVLYSFPDLLLIIIVVHVDASCPQADSAASSAALAILDAALADARDLPSCAGAGLVADRGETGARPGCSLKEREFIEAARASGRDDRAGSSGSTCSRNVLPAIVVAATLGIPRVILIEAALSFIGIGVQPPTPSWGAMILALRTPRERQPPPDPGRAGACPDGARLQHRRRRAAGSVRPLDAPRRRIGRVEEAPPRCAATNIEPCRHPSHCDGEGGLTPLAVDSLSAPRGDGD
jgi:peptide/nickel transport system permease protein